MNSQKKKLICNTINSKFMNRSKKNGEKGSSTNQLIHFSLIINVVVEAMFWVCVLLTHAQLMNSSAFEYLLILD
jgi:hypothetical protein